jgi:hypothetical protein
MNTEKRRMIALYSHQKSNIDENTKEKVSDRIYDRI